jgi:acetyl-CoA carboxylase biotin carboxyl carrier protein
MSDSLKEKAMAGNVDMDEINKFIKLLDEKNLTEFELEVDGFKIKLARRVKAAIPPYVPVPAVPAAAAAPAAPFPSTTGLPEPVEDKGPVVYVTSPMVGTFYRSPAPNAPHFVEVGEPVKKKQTLCIIEAMKLMNEIESEVDGLVSEVLVENGKPVEYGQRLFTIVPTA